MNNTTTLGKTDDGREFPMYNGELLCWSPGSYQTHSEEMNDFPRMRTVYRAIIAHRPQQLAYEHRELLKGSFNKMFGHNCRKALAVLEEEMIAKLIDLLRDAQVMADSMELVNGSGGEIGSLIGSIADELEVNNPTTDFIKAFTENKHGELA